jgi:uncharacterized membrane protein YkvA (DUF1232 family)
MEKFLEKVALWLEKIRSTPVLGSLVEDLITMTQLVSDCLKGIYEELPRGTVIGILAALFYAFSPVDLILDIIPFAGYLDDAAVISLILELGLARDLMQYRDWKRQKRLEAIEACAAESINVAATVSFTVPQVLAMAEAYQRGRDRAVQNGVEPGIGIAVLMVGRLDDYLRDVASDTRAQAGESDVIWAGTAAIKRAYGLFKKHNYDCILMPAGCRGGYHILELAGAEMVMSIAPGIASALSGERDLVEKIDRPVDPAILKRLNDMAEFRRACAPDGMSIDEFITFGACNRTLDQFVLMGWNVLKDLEL